ncbi:Predicted thiol oxidoreductase [Legionella beliardensis]|uniref:Predicted thiol oxidoreductase n=1 Tax=Legionella beliardensis TaxID=91822 RepID=A0A378I083_9GAMM|nr:di-heme oxidoredictase family protein [Legionella beliardensis]STX28569.1 Predicted thiol oxidoreductase [Legionella beliardensis]
MLKFKYARQVILATLFSLMTFNLYALDINLALNARAWASSEGMPAKNAVDGDASTRWGSAVGVDPSWIAVDLGKSYTLTSVVIDWEAANAEIYEVQGSNDANNWTTLAKRTDGVFGNRTDVICVSGTYRYVRVYGTKRSAGNQWGYSIWELKVYGGTGGSNPPDPGDNDFIPLYSSTTPLEPETVVNTPVALITRFADRVRDRHAREDEFHAYEHYLPFYWEYRTIQVEIVDEVAKGGNRIVVNVKSLWPLSTPDFRAFYRGINTVAEYFHNARLTPTTSDRLNYTTTVNFNAKEGRNIRNGDRMEIEISPFLSNPPRGRTNYYGTAFLYIVGQGIVPWEARGVFGNPNTEREDSYPIPVDAWLGGKTTIHHQYSAEPTSLFKQMATNTSNINGQPFVLGRRVHHTNMQTGAHSEAGNPVFTELANKIGTNYINSSCIGCHQNNGRALPPAVGTTLTNYMVVVADANGNPHPKVGSVLQPRSTVGAPEGNVVIQSWTESGGLRKPNYQFSGFSPAPARFSARITPQLVGMGLLEAIPESAIVELANATNKGNGVAGRINIVPDLETGVPRMGRFGWKAGKASVRQQIASALRNDMGVTTSLAPAPDCGAEQTNCGPAGAVLSDQYLDQLTDYIVLLGVRAQRDSEKPVVKQGKELFKQIGCEACHVSTFTTSPYHPHAELRNQVIHPYTDLLIHDMGPDLADNYGDYKATGSEWRTAPLWNIGLTAGVSNGEAYLHDGRARTLHEAIMWHGGEGSASRTAYNNLTPELRNAVITFLKSL